MSYFPSVIETTGRSSRGYDLPTKLLQDRIIYMSGEFNELSSDSVIMQLLWLASDDPEKDIDIYIKSPGGVCYDGLAIKNVIDTLPCKVNTVGMGLCASMGAFLLAGGTGVRKSTKDNRIMIHSVSGGAGGTYHDMKIDFKEVEKIQNDLMAYMSEFTKGKTSLEEMIKLSERDNYLTPEQALEIGLIDVII